VVNRVLLEYRAVLAGGAEDFHAGQIARLDAKLGAGAWKLRIPAYFKMDAGQAVRGAVGTVAHVGSVAKAGVFIKLAGAAIGLFGLAASPVATSDLFSGKAFDTLELCHLPQC